jgi:hypothetical protein
VSTVVLGLILLAFVAALLVLGRYRHDRSHVRRPRSSLAEEVDAIETARRIRDRTREAEQHMEEFIAARRSERHK